MKAWPKTLALCALALAAPVSAAATTDYPLVPVLDAAQLTCSPVAPLVEYERSLPAHGWQPFKPEAGTWLASYIASNADMGIAKVTHLTFAREVAGRPLIAYVAMIELDLGMGAGPSRSLSCEVFDLTAAGPVSAAQVERWAKRKAKTSTAGTDLVLMRWLPGLLRGSDETSITFIPADGPLAARRGGLAYSVIATLPKGAQ